MYALFKQGMQDPTFEDAPKPGTFDFKVRRPFFCFFGRWRSRGRATGKWSLLTLPQGKYKYNAWKKIVEEDVTPEDAQKRYVELIEKLKEKYGYDESKDPEPVGGN
jgi:diazepam-binding inhibitor (GABA receptor modulating acyl-CoA-binding protein)